MRLIDADLLTQKVKGWLNTDSNSDSIMIDANESVACVLREIEEQPTAYDVDKVVEQLNELKNMMYVRTFLVKRVAIQAKLGG